MLTIADVEFALALEKVVNQFGDTACEGLRGGIYFFDVKQIGCKFIRTSAQLAHIDVEVIERYFRADGHWYVLRDTNTAWMNLIQDFPGVF